MDIDRKKKLIVIKVSQSPNEQVTTHTDIYWVIRT